MLEIGNPTPRRVFKMRNAAMRNFGEELGKS